MRNTRLVRSYVFAGVGIGTIVWFTLKTDTSKIQHFYSSMLNRFVPTSDRKVINKVGNPDPHDIEDNKMVSEGAIYGVHYYNEKQQ